MKPHKDVLDAILRDKLKQQFISEILTDTYTKGVLDVLLGYMTEEEALLCLHEITQIPIETTYTIEYMDGDEDV